MKSLKTVVTLVGCAVVLALTVWFIWYFSRADVSEFHLKVSPKEFKMDLITRENHIKQEIAQEQDPQKKAEKQKELQVAQKQIEDPEQALKDYEVKAAAAYKALEDFKEEIGKRSLAKAKKALEQGDSSLAEKLFQEVLDKGSLTQKAEAAYQLGSLAENRINYGQADKYYRQALQLQPDNPRYLIGAGVMAHILGHYDEAEKLFKRALIEIGRNPWGPIHLNLASCLDEIAVIYGTQGKYIEAESYCRRALGIRERILGNEDTHVATSLNNLAELLRTQGKYEEAEPLCKQALGIREKALGPEHSEVAQSLNNLALLFRGQGKYGEAEPLYKRALAIVEKVEGPEHPHVATCLNNLAVIYREQGKSGQAELLYRRAIYIGEKALGPEHPDVATSLNNLAWLYYNQGKYGDAEPLYQRSLAIWEKALGSEHPLLATCLENYAALLRKMRRGAEAEPLEARAKAIRARQAETK